MIRMTGIRIGFKMNIILKISVYISLKSWLIKAVIRTIGVKVNKLIINSRANSLKLIFSNSLKQCHSKSGLIRTKDKTKNLLKLFFITKAKNSLIGCLLLKFSFLKSNSTYLLSFLSLLLLSFLSLLLSLLL
jgi:hypothetical protein